MGRSLHQSHNRLLCQDQAARLQKKIEECGDDLKELGPYDFVVCDANIHPAKASAMIAQLKPHMSAGCRVLLTLKLIGGKRDYKNMQATAKSNLASAGFTQLQELWLFSNTTKERTLLATLSPECPSTEDGA